MKGHHDLGKELGSSEASTVRVAVRGLRRGSVGLVSVHRYIAIHVVIVVRVWAYGEKTGGN